MRDLHAIAAELIHMAAEDQRVRAELAADGTLWQDYHPRMELLHTANATRLCEVLDEIGWPMRSLVGREAADAAWLVLQHATGHPELMRRGFELLKQLPDGQTDPVQLAMLEDRILTYEGKPQIYGTQYDWDQEGQLSPLPMDDKAAVNARRKNLGLGTVAEDTERKRHNANKDGERCPSDWSERERTFLAWLQKTGWRD